MLSTLEKWIVRVQALQPLLLLILAVAFWLRLYRIWDLPPGLWLDEAFYGLDALRVLHQQNFQIFFAQNGGREPLFIYLQALVLGIWGTDAWVLRVVPIAAGMATVALMSPLTRTFFKTEPRARAMGWLAAAALAVSFWHVSFSRLGMRVILLPLLSALTMYLFWRGWQSQRQRDFVWSGLALGVTMYTYLSARALPFVLLGFVLVSLALTWFAQRGQNKNPTIVFPPRRALQSLGTVLVVAFIVALPLFVYLAVNPTDLFGRAEAVALTASTNDELATPSLVARVSENALRVAGMFFVQGDSNPRHNLPLRPALDWLTAFGFIVGLGMSVVYARRAPIYILLWLWLVAMLLPSVLSVEAPHFLRTLGALPPAMIFVADGLTRVWQKLLPTRSFAWLALLVLCFGGITTFRDYFQIWASLPTVSQEAFDAQGKFFAARVLRETERADVLLPLRIYGRPTIQFALQESFSRAESYAQEIILDKPLEVMTAQGAADKQWVLLHRDAQGNGTVYFPHILSDVANQASAEPQPIEGYQGARAGQIILLKRKAKALVLPPTPTNALGVNFANQIRLVGADLNSPHVAPNQTVQVALYWQAIQTLVRDYRVFVQVVNDNGNVIASWDAEPVFGFYNTGLWQPNAVLTDLYPIQIPAETPPGEYKIIVGWTDTNQERLNVVDARGASNADTTIVGTLTITAP